MGSFPSPVYVVIRFLGTSQVLARSDYDGMSVFVLLFDLVLLP
jgi:hypothetical protein